MISFCSVKSKGKSRYYRDDETLKLIGSKIREFRINKEISQKNLANECDLDYSQLNRMELGKVNFSIFLFIPDRSRINVDPKELL